MLDWIDSGWDFLGFAVGTAFLTGVVVFTVAVVTGPIRRKK